ncbi:MAG: hypothetical protein Q8R82_17580 [Hyphomonadaceae bacterium]|nr:hypothetical protein [Hyphomonadaceae bacterium]
MKNLAAVCALAVVVAAPAFAQSYSPPRTPDGRPDLQGVWSNQSLTNLGRAPSMKLSVTPDEATSLLKNNPWILLAQSEEGASNLEDGLLEDKNSDRGYNTFWIDPGVSFATVKGELRTSWLVEPADGRVPVSAAGQKARVDAGARKRATMYEGPETLPIAERCLIGFTGAGGPGMLNTIYNNNYQIVQTRDAIMILVEMVHDARIIPIAASKAEARHKPGVIKPWLGDSVGWWEGDTLVVETINVKPEQADQGQIILSEKGKLTERFSRASDGQILYEFVVEDPVYYTQTWRAEMSLNKREESVYEYACHEGNYAMQGILGGARILEAQGRENKQGPGIFGPNAPPPKPRAGE